MGRSRYSIRNLREMGRRSANHLGAKAARRSASSKSRSVGRNAGSPRSSSSSITRMVVFAMMHPPDDDHMAACGTGQEKYAHHWEPEALAREVLACASGSQWGGFSLP